MYPVIFTIVYFGGCASHSTHFEYNQKCPNELYSTLSGHMALEHGIKHMTLGQNIMLNKSVSEPFRVFYELSKVALEKSKRLKTLNSTEELAEILQLLKDDEFIAIKNNYIFPYDRTKKFLKDINGFTNKTSINNQLNLFLNTIDYIEGSMGPKKEYLDDKIWIIETRFRLLSLALYYNQLAYDIAPTELTQRLISRNSGKIWQELEDPYEKARQKENRPNKHFRPGKADIQTRIDMDIYARFMKSIYQSIPSCSLSNFVKSLDLDLNFMTIKQGNNSSHHDYVNSFFNNLAFQHEFYSKKWEELHSLIQAGTIVLPKYSNIIPNQESSYDYDDPIVEHLTQLSHQLLFLQKIPLHISQFITNSDDNNTFAQKKNHQTIISYY